MPRLTVCQTRGPDSGLVSKRKLGALPLACACGLSGVRPITILGFNAITDGPHGPPEPARDVLGRRRIHQGMTHDQPSSEVPKIPEGLAPCVDFLACQM